MLLDIYHTESVYKEYERQINADLLARARLKASVEQTKTMAQGVSRDPHFVTSLAAMSWRWGQRIVRRWSGQPVSLTLPNKYQL